MSWITNLLAEGWPMFAAFGLVALITYGAVRPYLKGDKQRRVESARDKPDT